MDSALVAAGLLCVVIVYRFCQRGWLLGQVCFKWLSWPSAFSFLLVTFSPVFFRENLKFRKRKRWKSLCMPTNLCWTTCPPDTLESLCRCFTGYDVLIFSGSTFVGPSVGPSSDRIGKTYASFGVWNIILHTDVEELKYWSIFHKVFNSSIDSTSHIFFVWNLAPYMTEKILVSQDSFYVTFSLPYHSQGSVSTLTKQIVIFPKN
jgi:hypothetical protein